MSEMTAKEGLMVIKKHIREATGARSLCQKCGADEEQMHYAGCPSQKAMSLSDEVLRERLDEAWGDGSGAWRGIVKYEDTVELLRAVRDETRAEVLEEVAVKAAEGCIGCGCCSDDAAESIRALKAK